MTLVDRIIQALIASGAVRLDSPIDPSGTLAVLPMTPAVFAEGAWVTLPAGEATIEYQVNRTTARTPGGGIRFSIPFSIRLQAPDGQRIEIRPPRSSAVIGSGFGDAFVKTTYGTAELPSDGPYFVTATGKAHRRGNPHLRFV